MPRDGSSPACEVEAIRAWEIEAISACEAEADAARGNSEPDIEGKPDAALGNTEANYTLTQKRRPGADRPDRRLYAPGTGYDCLLYDVL